VPGAKKIKIRYGPWAVPAQTEACLKNRNCRNGALSTFISKVERPSEQDFMILQQTAGLEYSDGQHANVDTGVMCVSRCLVTIRMQSLTFNQD
jgi:hypothetical protein